MKKNYILFCLFFVYAISFAQDPFITTWQVMPTDLSITIPAFENTDNNGVAYDYSIDFGDGTVVNNVSGLISHTYAQEGIYTVAISGSFPSMNSWYQDSGEALNLLSVEQWGDIEWQTMQYAFAFCKNLVINAIDAPDLSQVEQMGAMFWEAESLNQSINHWDVSNVTNMGAMFWGAHSFNQPLNNWNVSNVVSMGNMFARDDVSLNVQDLVFNQPLDSWNVSNVTSMENMFSGTSMFDQPIGNWNVSGVSNMEEMFYDASSFNQPLDSWNVANVNTMKRMFQNASLFNQSLNSWNVTNVTDIDYMFSFTDAFNGEIGNWNISGITSLLGVFQNANAFNQPIGNWNVSNVTTMESTFNGALAFNQPIDSWTVTNVNSMYHMFNGTISFNQSLNSWNVSNVTTMTRIFQDATAFNGVIDNWDISGISSTSRMFENASSYNQTLNSWNVSGITSMGRMFEGASSFNQPLESWNISNVASMAAMFQDASSFNQSLNTWDFSGVNSLGSFLDNTGLSRENYDLFLEHLVSLNINNISLGAESLEYCSEVNRTILVDDRGWTINGDELSQECYSIFGSIYYDLDSNGCDLTEISDVPFFVNVTSNDFDFSKRTTNGSYTMSFNNQGPNIVSLINVPDYYTVTPQSTEVLFTDVGQSEQVDFCISANQTVEDLNITILPIIDARPGFESNYQLIVENLGTQAVTGITANFTFDNAMQSFVTASPSPVNTTVNTLEFDISALSPFQSQNIFITMQTFTPPTVNADEILNFSAAVQPNGNDLTPDNNSFEFDQVVVNSFDPNDKQVLQGQTISIDDTDNYLDYMVRFQNTGSASAINVEVYDVLHPNLDWSTLKVTSSSHNYEALVSNGNVVGFFFNNINLPDQTTDEFGSNGFIAYKIKPNASVQVGDVMSGNAFIVFDFNTPIVTNTVSTEVAAPLSVNEFENDTLLSVYPNPTDEGFYITTKPEILPLSITLYDIQGSQLLSTNKALDYINTKHITSGIYMLVIRTNKGNVVKKLIIN